MTMEAATEAFSSPLGQSFKLELTELSDVTDWSKLEVTGVAFTRRGNVLYLKGVDLGTVSVMIGYDGNIVRSFELTFTD
ncbi:minor capsid protein [Pectobacterium phage PP47]|uniref:Minor capsid protein n=1 Tax=Pectobacterium phage PP47 TaxID=1932882 RepID=A0A1P8L692_9CAUD|nr:minor capsid protein [Pectobacterium phage PP47]APW79777.1 minor capsid protein [Pectobacterium phage PP47]